MIGLIIGLLILILKIKRDCNEEGKRNGLVIIYLKMNGSHLNQIIQILNLRLDQENH